MDSVNHIIEMLNEKIKKEDFNPETPDPEEEIKEKKKPKKTEKQLFYLPNNIKNEKK